MVFFPPGVIGPVGITLATSDENFSQNPAISERILAQQEAVCTNFTVKMPLALSAASDAFSRAFFCIFSRAFPVLALLLLAGACAKYQAAGTMAGLTLLTGGSGTSGGSAEASPAIHAGPAQGTTSEAGASTVIPIILTSQPTSSV